MKKTISILGSTGSVGVTTLNIIKKKRDIFKIFMLSANKNYKIICNQISEYKPDYFIINDQLIFEKVKKKFKKNKTKILNNYYLLNSKKKIDITVSAIPGIAGLGPTVHLIKFSKKILIANKESVICGWNIIKKVSEKNKTRVVPIDSEHYSIFSLLKTNKIEDIEKIFITASGGPFLKYTLKKLKKIQPKDALKHPKWKMGKKITIDSSTLMNKILELIEAQKLFNIPKEKLDIIIHPESLVHAIVCLKNGLKKFIYHDTTMIIPIANAIFENHLDINNFYSIKESKINNLTFKKVNHKIFPIDKIKKRLNEYPSTSIIINATNEVLVDQFLNKKIAFLSIYKIIMAILNDRNYKKYAIKKPNNIGKIIFIDKWARAVTMEKCKSLK